MVNGRRTPRSVEHRGISRRLPWIRIYFFRRFTEDFLDKTSGRDDFRDFTDRVTCVSNRVRAIQLSVTGYLLAVLGPVSIAPVGFHRPNVRFPMFRQRFQNVRRYRGIYRTRNIASVYRFVFEGNKKKKMSVHCII